MTRRDLIKGVGMSAFSIVLPVPFREFVGARDLSTGTLLSSARTRVSFRAKAIPHTSWEVVDMGKPSRAWVDGRFAASPYNKDVFLDGRWHEVVVEWNEPCGTDGPRLMFTPPDTAKEGVVFATLDYFGWETTKQ